MKNSILAIIFLLLVPFLSFAQEGKKGHVQGYILDANSKEKIPFCHIKIIETGDQFISDESGYFKSSILDFGDYNLHITNVGYEADTFSVSLNSSITKINLEINPMIYLIGPHTVKFHKEHVGAIGRIKPIEGVMIAHGKKAEVINLEYVNGNLANNNARQIYATIPGLNIWESDGAGIQLGIGGRGLSPSRTANYNTRQNGYDISADALGYPESYYTPPSQAIEQIQFIKGAASLQFGPQFGGMINFKLKQGNKYREIAGVYQKTFSSFGSSSSYFDFGGTAKRWRYFTFFNWKTGNEWRPNSGYEVLSGGVNLTFQMDENKSIHVEYTKMSYVAQQPGGLTDYEFQSSPFTSKRERNWFSVDWNLWNLDYNHSFNSKNRLSSKFFGLLASRKALGYLGQINRLDPGTERNLIIGEFNNVGTETRFLKLYDIKEMPQAFLVGFRLYKGFSIGQQGFGNAGNRPDFYFVDNTNFEHSNYQFPSFNAAFFIENILRINEKTSFVPGLRFERIATRASGRYNEITTDLAGNIISNEEYGQELSNTRSFVIFGLGLNHKIKSDTMALYANISQNYRSINFADMQINNPNFKIDPNLEDERGFNGDIGLKGFVNDVFYYDLSIYGLFYNNRIGTTIRKDSLLFSTYQYRTNISQSLSAGFEGVVQLNWLRLFGKDTTQWHVSSLLNYSYTWARYLGNNIYTGNFVELVPPVNYKIGAQFGYKNINASIQYSWVHWQYSDASNSLSQANAVNGIIPTYDLLDIGIKYSFDQLTLSTGVNNVMNESYFTRRATAYPGPGIISSAPRNYYFTFGLKF